jgi:aminoglycoside N3'-acetyltransferase
VRREISRRELVARLRGLGVREGGVLLVHTSFRAVRPVDGGPDGLIDALLEALGPHGTLMMPSWTGEDDAPFDPRTTPPAEDLGILPALFWKRAGVARSEHAFAFAALGARADEMVRDGLPLPPHRLESPVGRLWEAGGQVLLLGVGHEANTTLHLAEVLADVPYGIAKHITTLENGKAKRIDYRETDHCCARFALADDWLRAKGLQREGLVGHGSARLIAARDLVSLALDHLRRDPFLFLHPPAAACAECDAARAGAAA